MAELVLPPKYDLNEYGQGIQEFDPERDLQLSPCWLNDAVHTWPPLTPAGTWYGVYVTSCSWGRAAEAVYSPYGRGVTWRTVRGTGYLTPLPIEDEEEIRRREPIFREKVRAYLEDVTKEYRANREALLRLYEPLKRMDFDKASDVQLRDAYHEFWDHVMWFERDTKFTPMYPELAVWQLFVTTCEELLEIDETSPLFLRLMQGFDNDLLKVDAEMERLAIRAVELGLKDAFAGPVEASEFLPKLEASQDGRKWLKLFQEFLDAYGMRSPRVADFDSYWLENPTPALVSIRAYALGEAAGVLAGARKEAIEDRKRAEEEMFRRIPEARRAEFELLLRAAQAIHVIRDEYELYWDISLCALGRHVMLGVGKRFAQYGIFDNPDDTLFLLPDEVKQTFFANVDRRGLARKRRQLWEQYKAETPRPMLYGSLTMEETMGRIIKARELILMSIVAGKMPVVRPELKADLFGVCVSGGVAEGIARVCINETDLMKIRKGEILVAPNTQAPWTWAFGLIRGVVVEMGGVVSHTAIVSREYRIPALVNAFGATAKIKTGQRIRVDANEGTVYILE